MGIDTIEAIEAAASYIKNPVLSKPDLAKKIVCQYTTKTVERLCQDTLYGLNPHDYPAISGVSPRKVAKTRPCVIKAKMGVVLSNSGHISRALRAQS